MPMTSSHLVAFARAARQTAAVVLAACATTVFTLPHAFAADAMTDDPYLWLEDVSGTRSLDWARARNGETARALETRPDYPATYASLLSIYNSRDRIPYVTRHGEWFYNVWQDDRNKRGLLRRTTLADYRKADVSWETVLDLDALAPQRRRTGPGKE